MSKRKNRIYGARRRKSRTVGAAIAALALSGCAGTALPLKMPTIPKKLDIPANDPAFRTRVYTGASMGNSYLKPNTASAPAFDVGNSSDIGTQLRLGVDVHNMLALEVDTTIMGAASLDNVGPDIGSEVSYSAASASALIYGLNGVQMRSMRQGWSSYARLGFGIVKKSSIVQPLEESGAGPILGAGVEYGFDNGLGIRGEITRVDNDAVFFGLGAVYRFGMSPSDLGGYLAESIEPALRSTETRVAADGSSLEDAVVYDRDDEPPVVRTSTSRKGPYRTDADDELDFGKPMYAARLWTPKPVEGDADGDGISDQEDRCLDSLPNTTVGKFGCGLFDRVLTEVTFKSGSAWLTPRSRGELDKVSITLLAFPEVPVQVRAHTDSQGSARVNQKLSERRGEAVVDYLKSRGVNKLQLQSVGVGEAEPLANNQTEENRRRNRRIELLTLPNLRPRTYTGPDSATMLASAVTFSTPSPIYAATPAKSVPPALRTRYIAAPEVEHVSEEPTLMAALPVVVEEPALAAALPEVIEAEPVAEVAAKEVPLKEVKVKQVAKSVQKSKPATKPRVMKKPAFPPISAVKIEAVPPSAYVEGLDLAGVVKGVTFIKGSADLTPTAKQKLHAVRDELIEFSAVRVAIMAHTDNQGESDANLRLSERRARSVVDFLVENGIERKRLLAEGYGEMLPLVQNVTEADRSRNRRIEIRILK